MDKCVSYHQAHDLSQHYNIKYKKCIKFVIEVDQKKAFFTWGQGWVLSDLYRLKSPRYSTHRQGHGITFTYFLHRQLWLPLQPFLQSSPKAAGLPVVNLALGFAACDSRWRIAIPYFSPLAAPPRCTSRTTRKKVLWERAGRPLQGQQLRRIPDPTRKLGVFALAIFYY